MVPHTPDQVDPGLAVPPDVLAVDPELMRALGYAVVDRTVDHLLNLGELPAIREGSPSELRDVIGGPLPAQPHDLEADLSLLADMVLTHQQHGDHPRYFARVAGPSSFPGILADWLGTGLQSVAASWGGGSGPTTVELVALDWLREALGLAEDCEGILLSGGSMANINGLIAARHLRGPGVVYLSDQTHASIPRGLRAMGQPTDDLRLVPTDDQLRLSPQALRSAIITDLAAGRRPAILVATAGTTNTGAFDDLPALAAICAEYDMWLHVDGAFGGAAALSPRGRRTMPGLQYADSFVTDPHKWLFQ
ncbi:MAG: pyridoxal phosphate-dependent decarboxylase family protein, partial [Actinomycetales bacterium]